MHLTSRRPPSAERCKAGKAERAPSSPAARGDFRWPPYGKNICHCDAHDSKMRHWMLAVNDCTQNCRRELGSMGSLKRRSRYEFTQQFKSEAPKIGLHVR